jgi:hypothetical protein
MGRWSAVGDRTTLLQQAAASAQDIWRDVTELEAETETVSLQGDEAGRASAPQLWDAAHFEAFPCPPVAGSSGSPINPRWVNDADCLAFLSTKRSAFVLGLTEGAGFVMARQGLGDDVGQSSRALHTTPHPLAPTFWTSPFVGFPARNPGWSAGARHCLCRCGCAPWASARDGWPHAASWHA